MSKIEYKTEVSERCGNTPEYKECMNKSAFRTEKEEAILGNHLMDIFTEFGKIKDSASPDSEEARTLVKKLQDYISANYYNCTEPILKSLGKMYIEDSRFKENIDMKGGEGTALFVSKAIEIY